MSRRWVKSLRVPTSSAPIRRLYPSTSAAKIATSLRSVSPVLVKTRPRTAPGRLLRVRRREYPEVSLLRLVLGKRRCPFGVKADIGGGRLYPRERTFASAGAKSY